VLADAGAAERIAPALAARGWERTRTLFMALAPSQDPPPRDPRARELSEDELEAIQFTAFTQDARGLAAELVDAQRALRRATPARGFGAGPEGELHAMATLFLDSEVAGRPVGVIDQVATLREHREQGLARATLAAAIRAARAWGAELVAIAVDADDWPQLMYARLGFAPASREVAFTRRVGSE
jgi:GNAT superfamily N-acetyltransferase